MTERDVQRLDILPAGTVDVRRDVYHFVRYVADKGLVRTKRANGIPKGAARRLAKLLSYAGEADAVETEGGGFWSDHISHVARGLAVVSFDTKGVYEGYSSAEPSFPDNEIKVEERAWRAYLKKTPLKKERALLDVHLKTTPNEFFDPSLLVGFEVFEHWGCATGPASRMNLPKIRRGLLDFLARLEPNVWYELCDVVDLLKARAPTLVLDPDSREPDTASRQRLRTWELDRDYGKKSRAKKPEMTLEDIYSNFREYEGEKSRRDRHPSRQITEQTPDAFNRVEGRYLESFLCGIPYLFGFLDLALRKETDPHGKDVFPPRERVRAFRLSPRFFQLLGGDAAFDRVKVVALPTFEVLVEAPSYPDRTLEELAPLTTLVHADGPVQRLRLERSKVIAAAAQDPGARPAAELLKKLTGSSLPQNVAVELASWSGRGEKVTLFEGFALLECRGAAGARQKILGDLGELVEDKGPEGFALVRRPEGALRRLEERHHVPLAVHHRAQSFAACAGRLGAPAKSNGPARDATRSRTPPVVRVRLESEDLVGYRASCPALLRALQDALRGEARTCAIVGDDLLVLSASALPRLRGILRRLSDRFDVTIAAAAPAEAAE